MAVKQAPFVIHTIKDRKITETVYSVVMTDEKGKPVLNDNGQPKRKIVPGYEVTRVVPESYLVKFRAGHSCWFETKEAMAKAGVREDVQLDDEDEDITHLIVDTTKAGSIEAAINASLGD